MHLTNVLVYDTNTLNLDLPVYDIQSCLFSFAHFNLFHLLASLPRRPASWNHLFTVEDETGVLLVVFNKDAS